MSESTQGDHMTSGEAIAAVAARTGSRDARDTGERRKCPRCTRVGVLVEVGNGMKRNPPGIGGRVDRVGRFAIVWAACIMSLGEYDDVMRPYLGCGTCS